MAGRTRSSHFPFYRRLKTTSLSLPIQRHIIRANPGLEWPRTHERTIQNIPVWTFWMGTWGWVSLGRVMDFSPSPSFWPPKVFFKKTILPATSSNLPPPPTYLPFRIYLPSSLPPTYPHSPSPFSSSSHFHHVATITSALSFLVLLLLMLLTFLVFFALALGALVALCFHCQCFSCVPSALHSCSWCFFLLLFVLAPSVLAIVVSHSCS